MKDLHIATQLHLELPIVSYRVMLKPILRAEFEFPPLFASFYSFRVAKMIGNTQMIEKLPVIHVFLYEGILI